MKNTIIITLLLALTGCASPYYKAGADKSDWNRDMYDCEAKNRTAHPAMMLVDLQNAYTCMEMEKGWRRGE